MASSARFGSVTRAENRRLQRLVRLAALILVIGTVAFVAFYFTDQHTDPGPTLAQRSVTETEALVRKNPNDLALRLKLAASYSAAQRTDDALAQYDTILTAAPDNVTALLGKADIIAPAGDPGGAVVLYQRVVDLRKGGEMASADTDLERAYFGLGSVANARGDYGRAIAALESAVRIDGTDADAWYVLGQAQLAVGSAQQAIAAERNAVAFVPLGWSEPYAVMSRAYASQGKTAQTAWANAMIDLIAKQDDKAKAELTGLVDGPAAADAMVGLAFLAESRGDDAAALAWYRKTLTVDPQNANAQSGVSRLAGDGAAPSSAPSVAAPAGS